MSGRPPRGELNAALDRLVTVERADLIATGLGCEAPYREWAWDDAVETVRRLEFEGALGWLTAAELTHYLQRQGADARAFVAEYLVLRAVPPAAG